MVNLPALAVALAAPLVGGQVASLSTLGGVGGWYQTINKPKWTPNPAVFPLAWGLLYLSMGYARYLVWEEGGFAAQARALAWYLSQLILNLGWQPLFFLFKRLDLATADVAALWVLIAATIRAFRPVIGDAALWLLGPYLAWVTFAAALTVWIWHHNPALGKQTRGVPARSHARAA